MQSALVIADDLSGAAEVAGIGYRYGLPARLVRRPPAGFEPGLTVIDTDSRALPPDGAAAAMTQVVASIDPASVNLIYKKTDSVLRGPVAAELDALMAALRRPAALLVPQNPSRGRVIINGKYLIDGVPLHETSFARDPTHPARSANAMDLLGRCASGITIGDGRSAADLRDAASRLSNTTLPAGGADFFTALLEHAGLTATRPFLNALPHGPRLYVCGSAAPYPFLPHVADRPMMGDAAELWSDAVCRLLAAGYDARMTIDLPLDQMPGAAARIERTVASVAASALRRCLPKMVFITGGATASAVCREMAWDTFDVVGEFATGVVLLRPRGATTLIVMKPGSYPWPHQFGGVGETSLRVGRPRTTR